MTDLFSGTLMGVDLDHWLACGLYVVGALVVGKLIAVISSTFLRRVAAKTRNRLDDIVLAIVEKPLVFIIFMIGLGLGIGRLGLEDGAALWTSRVVGILTTLAVAWAIDKAFEAIIREYLAPAVAKSESKLDDQMLPLARNGAKILIWVLAFLIALKNSGYDVGALLAGLGIGGAAIALAAKDTLSNLFGSLAVFVDKPFALGDRVKVAGFDGNITEIGVRISRLTTLDNRVVTIPNSVFSSTAIENVSSEPSTKVVQSIELSPSIGAEGAARALELLRESAVAQDGLAEGTVAALSGFGQYSLKVTFVVFVKKGADYFGTLSALNLEVLRRFAGAGIELARPVALVADKR